MPTSMGDLRGRITVSPGLLEAFYSGESTMTTAVTLVGKGFPRRTRELAETVANDACLTRVELLGPTRRAREGRPSYEQAARAAGTSWPTLPGYEILGVLGRGGMGTIYKARHLGLHRLMAIKVSELSLAGEGDVARFHQEQRLAVRLRHPNLVAAYDAGQVADVPYLVLELVEGHDLAFLVRKRGPLPAGAACEVGRQAALGLQHLHNHGLVHRDVKPANLMLTPSGRVKLLDLGLARDLHASAPGGQITSTGQCLGTLAAVRGPHLRVLFPEDEGPRRGACAADPGAPP
jgi:serine/threonine protein kinase